MKAKFYFGILSTLLLAGYPLKAQIADKRDFRNDDAGLIINNYYDDYDYYYSSRINRFHRSYTAFDYYSPLFTDSYWYNYQPYTWGLSIYGRNGLGFGFSFNYPVYYYGWGFNYLYNYDYGWYDPYYGNDWYWGYDPFYYRWYSPVAFNINLGHRWRYDYWGDRWDLGHRTDFRSNSNYNFYDNSPRYSSREFPSKNRFENNRENGGYSRRGSMTPFDRQTDMNGNNGRPASDNGIQRNRGQRDPNRNTGNFGQNNSNSGNNGNNTNSRQNGNNGNFGNTNSNNNGSVNRQRVISGSGMENSNNMRYGNTMVRPSRPQAETRPSMPSERGSSANTNSRSERTFNALSRSSSPSRQAPQARSSSSGGFRSQASKSTASRSKSSKGSSTKDRGRK